ncbi:MAG: hypothetical protein KatS3mg031_0404 [Chitinophagales bacterium]|nr:MAG: hypothetical protein KatS3mg031_0404 [Chitinophagales bacterium]
MLNRLAMPGVVASGLYVFTAALTKDFSVRLDKEKNVCIGKLIVFRRAHNFARLIIFMSLERKVRAVERLFRQTDDDLQRFRAESGLQCKIGCGACCTKPDIHATVLEFLPFAYQCFREGCAEQMLEVLRNNHTSFCALFRLTTVDSQAGNCSAYQYRGLICRLFGFSAYRDKYGKPTLVTCRTIKETAPVQYEQTVQRIACGNLQPPLISCYYMRLSQIDPTLGTEQYPINVAITEALETVLHYYSYRRPPGSSKKKVA